MQKVLIISTLIFLSMTNLVKAKKNHEYSCEILSKCQMCLSDKELASWLSRRSEKYGNALEIVRELGTLTEGKLENNFDKEFYSRYGAFFFIYHATGKYEDNNKLKVLKLLLENGVHPYMKIIEEVNLVTTVINANDRKAFGIILESGLLLDCELEFQNLLSYTKNKKMYYYLDRLKTMGVYH